MKRRISIILIVLLLCLNSTALQAFAFNHTWSGQAIADFLKNDVDAPNVLVNEKYLENITRAELCELVIAIYAKSLNIGKNEIIIESNPFHDTTSLDVQRAYSLGIVKGISEDTFLPDAQITREQMVTIITRFLNVKEVNTGSNKDLSDFIDNANTSEWAIDAMRYCVEKGIIEGYIIYGEKELRPQYNTTIEQAITVLDRIAVEAGWLTTSSDIFLGGFFVPSDTELEVGSGGGFHSVVLSAEWKNVTDLEKLKADILYVFEHNSIANEVIAYIFDEESNTYKEFSGDGFWIGVNIGEREDFSMDIRRTGHVVP